MKTPRKAGKPILVQAILPADLAAWCRQQAKTDGIKVGAWVRRLLMRERGSAAGLSERVGRLERAVKELQWEVARIAGKHGSAS